MPHSVVGIIVVLVAGVVCEQFYSHFKIRIHIFRRKHFLPAFAISFFFSSSFSCVFFCFYFFPPLSSIAKCFRLAVWISNDLLLFDVIKQQGTKLAEEREERKIGGAGNAMIINKVAGAELATKKGFKMRDHRETRLRDHIRSAWGNNERVPSLKKTVNGISIWSMMQEAGSPIKREEVFFF